MLDRDLASLYGVETRVLNQAVKRNINRFPDDFMFQLSKDECLRSQIVTLKEAQGRHLKYMPYVFTESGVAMLSSVLKSQRAIDVNISIMRAFVAMRHLMIRNASLLQRMDRLEMKQFKTDAKVDAILDKLNDVTEAKQGILFDGQIFDAYVIISTLIRKAVNRIVVIDNYIDESVLVMLAKRNAGVVVEIYTPRISQEMRQDVERHNAQYPGVTLHRYTKAHDRFLIIDNDVYLIGASLKDLGKKLFGFSKMEAADADELLSKIRESN